MVYVVWYESSRRVFYDITQLRNFLKTVPLAKVKIFEQDAFGNMIPIDPTSFFVGRSFRPAPDLHVDSMNEQNIAESNNNRAFVQQPSRELLDNSLNNINIENFGKKQKSFAAFIVKILLIMFGILMAYLILPSLISAIFS